VWVPTPHVTTPLYRYATLAAAMKKARSVPLPPSAPWVRVENPLLPAPAPLVTEESGCSVGAKEAAGGFKMLGVKLPADGWDGANPAAPRVCMVHLSGVYEGSKVVALLAYRQRWSARMWSEGKQCQVQAHDAVVVTVAEPPAGEPEKAEPKKAGKRGAATSTEQPLGRGKRAKVGGDEDAAEIAQLEDRASVLEAKVAGAETPKASKAAKAGKAAKAAKAGKA
jgi:hypothetical protein